MAALPTHLQQVLQQGAFAQGCLAHRRCGRCAALCNGGWGQRRAGRLGAREPTQLVRQRGSLV